MGISDDDFYKAKAVNSNTQLYKQAGNAIVVPVLESIFKELFYGYSFVCPSCWNISRDQIDDYGEYLCGECAD